MSVWGAIADALGVGQRAIEAKRDIKLASYEAEKQRLIAQAKAVSDTASWEQSALQDAKNSWKDEWWTLIFSVPLIMAFIPSLAPYVSQGFEALSGLPSWYQWGLGAAWSLAFATKKGGAILGLFRK